MTRLAFSRGCLFLPVVLGSLVLGCSKQEQTDQEPSARLVLDAAPNIPSKLEVGFGDQLTLLGYDLAAPKRLRSKSKLRVTFYWRVDKSPDPQTLLSTKLVSEQGETLVNADELGELRRRREGKPVHAPGQWQVGKIYVDTQEITCPDHLRGKSVQLMVGMRQGERTIQPASGSVNQDGYLSIATIAVEEGGKSQKVPQLSVPLVGDKAVKLDGKLDEEAWKTAASVANLVKLSTDKAPATNAVNRGAARLLWSPKALYLGIEVHDEDLTGGFKKGVQDPPLWKRDTVEMFLKLDGKSDNKNYYRILVSPQNFVFDSAYADFKTPMDSKGSALGDTTWSSKVRVATAVNGTLDDAADVDQGYVQEIEIPWSSFDRGEPFVAQANAAVWTNFAIRSGGEVLGFSAILGDNTMHAVRRMGKLVLLPEGAAAGSSKTNPLFKDLPKAPAPPPAPVAEEAAKNAPNPAASAGTPASAMSATSGK